MESLPSNWETLAIYQYDKNKVLVKQWANIAEILDNINTIKKVTPERKEVKKQFNRHLSSKTKICYDHIWSFSDNLQPLTELVDKPIYQYDLQGCLIKVWNKKQDIIDNLEIPHDKSNTKHDVRVNINAALAGRQSKAYDSYWSFNKDFYITKRVKQIDYNIVPKKFILGQDDECPDDNEEYWKPLQKAPDRYLISNYGRLYSIGKSIIKKTSTDDDGYDIISMRLEKHGTPERFKIGRLVATHFIPNDDPETKTLVDHIDRTRNNDFYKNLRWVTPSENSKNTANINKPKGERVLYEPKDDEEFINIETINDLDFSNYEVSNYGTVRKVDSEYIINPKLHNGYYRIELKTDNKERKTFANHLLVATFFCEKGENDTVVKHIDKNKLNNHYTNLKWTVPSDINPNMKAVHKINQQGKIVGRYKSLQDAINNHLKVFPNSHIISSGLSKACRTNALYCGYRWKYEDKATDKIDLHNFIGQVDEIEYVNN